MPPGPCPKRYSDNRLRRLSHTVIQRGIFEEGICRSAVSSLLPEVDINKGAGEGTHGSRRRRVRRLFSPPLSPTVNKLEEEFSIPRYGLPLSAV